MNQGKCPHCEEVMGRLNSESVKMGPSDQFLYGLALSCPGCDTVISVIIDPERMVYDIVEQVKSALGK